MPRNPIRPLLRSWKFRSVIIAAALLLVLVAVRPQFVVRVVSRVWREVEQIRVAPATVVAGEDRGLHAGRPTASAVPVSLIFDTDLGNDVDDSLALALIHELIDRGEAELLAVSISKDNPWCAPHADILNTFFGRPDIPIGVVRGGKTTDDGRFNRVVVEKEAGGLPVYAHDLRSGTDAPEAVALLREVLAAQPDHSVVFVSVGFQTNTARLLDSPPDHHSTLPGLDLVRQKVRLHVSMLGAFNATRQPEYNATIDTEATRAVLARWPTPLVAAGFEIGNAILFPATSIVRDFGYVDNHPVVDAYNAFLPMPYDRPTWDLTAVLYAVRPDHGYFSLTEPGTITLDDRDITRFAAHPSGKHRYLVLARESIPRIREVFVQMVSSPPLESGR